MSKKFIIKVTTNWCGMDAGYSAIAKKEEDLKEVGQQLAYDNFEMYDYISLILKEQFPEEDEYTEEQYTEAYEAEGEYYEYSIKEFDAINDDWDDYELVYNCDE